MPHYFIFTLCCTSKHALIFLTTIIWSPLKDLLLFPLSLCKSKLGASISQLDIKFISTKIWLMRASAGSTQRLWKEILMHEQPCHYPISSVIRYFSFWADAFFLSVFSSPINIWFPGFENEAKCSGSSIEAPRTHVHTTYVPTTTDRMCAPGAERHTDWFVEYLGRLNQ